MLQENNLNILQKITAAIQNQEKCELNLASLNINDATLKSITKVIKNSGIAASSININLEDNSAIRSQSITPFLNVITNHIKNEKKDNTIKLNINFNNINIGANAKNYLRAAMDAMQKKLVPESIITFGKNGHHNIRISTKNNNKRVLDTFCYSVKSPNNDMTQNIDNDYIKNNNNNDNDVSISPFEVIDDQKENLASNLDTLQPPNIQTNTQILENSKSIQNNEDNDSTSPLPDNKDVHSETESISQLDDNNINDNNNDIDPNPINENNNLLPINDDIISTNENNNRKTSGNNNDIGSDSTNEPQNQVPTNREEKQTTLVIKEQSTPITIENIHHFLGYWNIGLTFINAGINAAHLYISPTEENKVTLFVDLTKISGIGLTAYNYAIGPYFSWLGAGTKVAYNFYKKDHYEMQDIIQEIIPPAALMTILPQLTKIIVSPDTSTQTKTVLISLEVLMTLSYSYTVFQNGNNLVQNDEIGGQKDPSIFGFNNNKQPLSGDDQPHQTEL